MHACIRPYWNFGQVWFLHFVYLEVMACLHKYSQLIQHLVVKCTYTLNIPLRHFFFLWHHPQSHFDIYSFMHNFTHTYKNAFNLIQVHTPTPKTWDTHMHTHTCQCMHFSKCNQSDQTHKTQMVKTICAGMWNQIHRIQWNLKPDPNNPETLVSRLPSTVKEFPDTNS